MLKVITTAFILGFNINLLVLKYPILPRNKQQIHNSEINESEHFLGFYLLCGDNLHSVLYYRMLYC